MHDKLLQMLVMEDEYTDISVILKQFGKTKNWFQKHKSKFKIIKFNRILKISVSAIIKAICGKA